MPRGNVGIKIFNVVYIIPYFIISCLIQGEMEITPACYSHFTNSLMGLANGRLAVVLEVSVIVTDAIQQISLKLLSGRILLEIFV